MERDPSKFLWDACLPPPKRSRFGFAQAGEAADAIAAITKDKTFADFDRDLILRSAVERQFEIVGEALAQLARRDPAMAARVPEHRDIIAFRNVLIHGYAVINRARVWRAVEEDIPKLRAVLAALLGEK